VLHDPARYGDAFADVYDDWYRDAFDTEGAVAALVALAGDGPVLELGVGTGRLAIPMAREGLPVVGVDASAAMLERLAAKDGGHLVRAVLGDMADLDALADLGDPDRRAAPPFSLVFAAYNTFFNLDTEAAQRRCLRSCAALLADGATLVVEAFVPAEGELARTSLDVRSVTVDAVVLTATEIDLADQVVTGQHVEIRDGSVRLRPWRVRYLSPAQLDALASACGLVRVERWGGWDRRAFDDSCQSHVTLYRRAAVGAGGP